MTISAKAGRVIWCRQRSGNLPFLLFPCKWSASPLGSNHVREEFACACRIALSRVTTVTAGTFLGLGQMMSLGGSVREVLP